MTEFEIDFDHFDLDHFDHKFLIFNNVAKNFVVTKTFPIFARCSVRVCSRSLACRKRLIIKKNNKENETNNKTGSAKTRGAANTEGRTPAPDDDADVSNAYEYERVGR